MKRLRVPALILALGLLVSACASHGSSTPRQSNTQTPLCSDNNDEYYDNCLPADEPATTESVMPNAKTTQIRSWSNDYMLVFTSSLLSAAMATPVPGSVNADKLTLEYTDVWGDSRQYHAPHVIGVDCGGTLIAHPVGVDWCAANQELYVTYGPMVNLAGQTDDGKAFRVGHLTNRGKGNVYAVTLLAYVDYLLQGMTNQSHSCIVGAYVHALQNRKLIDGTTEQWIRAYFAGASQTQYMRGYTAQSAMNC